MEHELFQSDLKPSVDGALLSKIIRTGEKSHRAAVIELIFERSIQECRESVSMEANDSLRSGHLPQFERSTGGLNNSIPSAESPIPVTGPQPVSWLPRPESQLAPSETLPPNPRPVSEPVAMQGDASGRQNSGMSGSRPSGGVLLRCSVSSCKTTPR